MRVDWTRRARSDLKAISEYIERDRNLATANHVTRVIFDTIQSLANIPYRRRPGAIENTRELARLSQFARLAAGKPFRISRGV